MKNIIRHFLLLALLSNLCVFSAEPTLTISSLNREHHYDRASLLASNRLEMIHIDNNRAYPGRKMTLASIKLCELLKPYAVRPDAIIEFIAADGFSVDVPANKIMTCNHYSAIAYIAIEPEKKWPLLDNGTQTTAGPFDVIWLHPEKSYISNEYWAWSVTNIAIHQTLQRDLLKLKPIHASAQVKHGYDIYISHCAGCHTINHLGKAIIGPDLKDPKTPFDYYPDEQQLKQFIRDPQSIRPGRMSGSGEDFLNNADLNALIAYLKYIT